MTGTRCTCGAGHQTFGACMRAKNLRIQDATYRSRETECQRDLSRYEAARREGIQPDSITRQAVDYALRRSDREGVAFRADTS